MHIMKVIFGGVAALVAVPAVMFTLAAAAVATPLLFFTFGSKS
jgi:hypothetical protein